jgi:hypothetical protein
LEIVIGGFTGFKQRLADLIEPAPHALPKRDTEKSMTGWKLLSHGARVRCVTSFSFESCFV